MDFTIRFQELSARVARLRDRVNTEEATKTAFVMPFLSALGYDVFDPDEVIPEFDADVSTKKGEKVDYAVKLDGKIIMLIEAKHAADTLVPKHTSQLYRYFSVTEARIAVLTNGLEYRFFSDLDEPNKMDSEPFLTVNMLNLRESSINEMRRLARGAFDLDSMIDAAAEMKYLGGIKRVVGQQFVDPSPAWVKLIAGEVYGGKRTKAVLDLFTRLTKRAMNEFITDRINSRLNAAMEPETPVEEMDDDEAPSNDGIVTTDQEVEGFHIVRAILAGVVDVNRVTMRDTKSYCGVLLDDNNRKPICRLHFNRDRLYIGIFDAEKRHERITIKAPADIYAYADHLRETALRYTAGEDSE